MLGSKLAAPRLPLELPAGRTKPINYIPQGELYNVPNNFSGPETQIDLSHALSRINLTHAHVSSEKGSSLMLCLKRLIMDVLVLRGLTN